MVLAYFNPSAFKEKRKKKKKKKKMLEFEKQDRYRMCLVLDIFLSRNVLEARSPCCLVYEESAMARESI